MHVNEVTHQITDAYWHWREDGQHCPYHVRYPVGFNHKAEGLCALVEKDGTYQALGYIEARKQIYLPIYAGLVRQESKFRKLQGMLHQGTNLLIIEVDGPHGDDLAYYQQRYGVDALWIENNTILINQANIEIMLNDPKHPFGHGYCLAMTLLGQENTWNGGHPLEMDQKDLFDSNSKTQRTFTAVKNQSGITLYEPTTKSVWTLATQKSIEEVTLDDFKSIW